MDEDGEKENPAVKRGGLVEVGRGALLPETISDVDEWQRQALEGRREQERLRREHESKEEARRISEEPYEVLLEELRAIKELVEELPGVIRRYCGG